jgi:hypothetical protein
MIGETVLFLICSPPSSPWGQSLSAVKAVEAITGIKVQVVYANDTSQMAAEILCFARWRTPGGVRQAAGSGG